jgi:hypothetical protein
MSMDLRKLVKNRLGTDHAISSMIDQSTYSNNIIPTIEYLDQIDTWRNSNWRKLFPQIQEHLIV